MSQESVSFWKPTIFNLKPPSKPFKYVFLSILALTGIINRDFFFQTEFMIDGSTVSSCLCVPKFFKWPYMGKKDVQIMYVVTTKKNRGKGFAQRLLRATLSQLKQLNGKIWYVTDIDNLASISTAKKLGFKEIQNVY